MRASRDLTELAVGETLPDRSSDLPPAELNSARGLLHHLGRALGEMLVTLAGHNCLRLQVWMPGRQSTRSQTYDLAGLQEGQLSFGAKTRWTWVDP